jgi:hypothetical protein
VRKSSHLVMTAWVECNHPWGKNKSQESMGEEDFGVGKRVNFTVSKK